MIRKSYKYAFYFSILIIISMLAVSIAFKIDYDKSKQLPLSVTTSSLVKEQNLDLAPSARSAVIIDAKSGAVLYEKNSSLRLPMASTTKIMTALSVLETAKLDDVITVTSESVGIEGTKIYLKDGEKITVKDLLYGLLLESGNDAATALAIGVFGSVESCCNKMNEIAHTLGLVDTCFENPHGLDSENHYTTAYELALIAKKAMENDTFRQIVSSKNYVTTGETKRYFSNHNRLIKKSRMFTGVKTGYTSKSGRCLVSSAESGNEEYIAVTLGCKNDWKEHENMYAYAIESFKSIEIAQKNNFMVFAAGKAYSPVENIYLTTDSYDDFALSYKITIQEGKGKVQYFADSMPLGSFSIIE